MSAPSDSIIENWNKTFRPWSQNYIKPYKSAILRNCLFASQELAKGHSSALRDIEKNKGNIAQFVLENTQQKYLKMLPNKILSDTYIFMETDMKSKYKMVFRSVLSSFISWKPGTSNALSKEGGLTVTYGNESFLCKFRKYQLESMKKFIQATPGTKEIRGQWTVNLANDAMMVTFGNNDVILVIKIGCFSDKLNIMYEENGVLRKNSKIRKQTLKTSCFGLEKSKMSHRFCNSVIIQENYGISLFVDQILTISPVSVYVKRDRMHALVCDTLRINHLSVALNKRPFHITKIQIPTLTTQNAQMLRLKYRESLTKTKSKTKTKTKISKSKPKKANAKPKAKTKTKAKVATTKEELSTDDSDFCPIKPKNVSYSDSDDSKWYTNDDNSDNSKAKSKNKKTSAFDDDSKWYITHETHTPQTPFAPIITPQTQTQTPMSFANDSNMTFTPFGSVNDTTPMEFSIPPNLNQLTRDLSNDSLNNLTNINAFELDTMHRTPSINSMDSIAMHNEFVNNHNFGNINAIPPPFNMGQTGQPFMAQNMNNTNINNSEMQQLRYENELLMRRVSEQQRQIEFLASQIGVNAQNPNYYYIPQSHNPLKRRRIQDEALLPPAA